MPIRHDRYFTPEPTHKRTALMLYERVVDLPLICPHGHVDPALFADPDYHFASPADLFIIPDHYVTRMLYSQGIALEALGVPTRDGSTSQTDHRRIWRLFAENFHWFRGTPSGIWIREELESIFGITEPLTAQTADRAYDIISAALAQPDFTPRQLYERFQIETLCTTDAATDTLDHHQAIRSAGWSGRILPTFRPDGVVDVLHQDWRRNLDRLRAVSGIDVRDYPSFMEALAQRRTWFRSLGATASDHGYERTRFVPYQAEIAQTLFGRALQGTFDPRDFETFNSHVLMDLARMATEDGMIMQLHVGSWRNHNAAVFSRFGRDKGADIPIPIEFTRDLHAFLEQFGNSSLTVILFTLDETVYSRELAPLAGHYPALRLGPPWWFHDSPNGMRRFFDGVMETAGIYNTVGFNDDTRAFLSIPARHDLWRRMACDWLAGLLLRDIIDEQAAHEMAYLLAYGLAKEAYKL